MRAAVCGLQTVFKRRGMPRGCCLTFCSVQQAPNGEEAAEEDEEEPAADKQFPLPMLHSDNERREFICAGAAAGIAVRPMTLWAVNPAAVAQLAPMLRGLWCREAPCLVARCTHA